MCGRGDVCGGDETASLHNRTTVTHRIASLSTQPVYSRLLNDSNEPASADAPGPPRTESTSATARAIAAGWRARSQQAHVSAMDDVSCPARSCVLTSSSACWHCGIGIAQAGGMHLPQILTCESVTDGSSSSTSSMSQPAEKMGVPDTERPAPAPLTSREPRLSSVAASAADGDVRGSIAEPPVAMRRARRA